MYGAKKTNELIQTPFGGLGPLGWHMGQKNHVLDGGPDRMNPFAAARGDKLLWHLSFVTSRLLWSYSKSGWDDSVNENR